MGLSKSNEKIEKIDGYIRELSADELLNNFHNNRMEQYLATLINIKHWGILNPDDIVMQKQGMSLGNQQPVLIKIKAKDALKRAQEDKRQHEMALAAIKAVREDFKIKSN